MTAVRKRNAMPQEHKGSSFPQTRWTLVARSARAGLPEAQLALEELCGLYWQPLYLYLRRTGAGAHDAEDMTQEFFAHVFEKQIFTRADSTRGRLRSFLLRSLKNFAADRRKLANAEKRGGGEVPLSIDFLEAERGYQPESKNSPEREFEIQWATRLLENALANVRQDYESSGRSRLFEKLHPLISWNARSRPQKEVAIELGLNESAMRVALHRLRSKFGNAVRELVADTVADPSEVDDEIRQLFKILSESSV